MRKGWIIVNHFLKTNKFTELYNFFKNASEKHDIQLALYTNAEVSCMIHSEFDAPDFVIFWDKDIRLAKLLEQKGLRLFNNSNAIESCDDKYLTYLKLKENSIPTPLTLSLPMTYENIGYNDTKFIEEYADFMGLPLILKENFGSFGEQVYLLNSKEELISLIKSKEGCPMIIQEYISRSFGKDIRINIVGGNVVASMERYSTCGDFRANLSIGGSMRKITPDDEACTLAVKASKALGLDFCGVDLLYAENGYTVCEVNSNAHFKNIYDLTGIDFAEKIIQYIGEII